MSEEVWSRIQTAEMILRGDTQGPGTTQPLRVVVYEQCFRVRDRDKEDCFSRESKTKPTYRGALLHDLLISQAFSLALLHY